LHVGGKEQVERRAGLDLLGKLARGIKCQGRGHGRRRLALKPLDQSRQDALQVGGGRDPQWLGGGRRQAASSEVQRLLFRGTRTAAASGGGQCSNTEYPETSRNDRSGHPDSSSSAPWFAACSRSKNVHPTTSASGASTRAVSFSIGDDTSSTDSSVCPMSWLGSIAFVLRFSRLSDSFTARLPDSCGLFR